MARSSRKISNGARDAILDAAEELFAVSGFDGVPVREIAKKADVGLSLVTYHFASKETLFEEVIARRADELNARRAEMLAAAVEMDEWDLRSIVEAFTRPFLDLVGLGDEHWKNYGELVAQVAQSPKQSHIVKANFDEIARQIIDAIAELYDEIDNERATRAAVFSVSVMLSAFSAVRRVESLSFGKYSSSNISEIYPIMLDYICGGIERIMSQPR